MISSVPYVPPDTMKKVAATSGQSVNFATLFLVMETAREGNCAGTDIELNFYSRPPKGNSLSSPRKSEFAREEYRSHFCMQEENARERIFFRSATRILVPLDCPHFLLLKGLLSRSATRLARRLMLDCSFTFAFTFIHFPRGIRMKLPARAAFPACLLLVLV